MWPSPVAIPHASHPVVVFMPDKDKEKAVWGNAETVCALMRAIGAMEEPLQTYNCSPYIVATAILAGALPGEDPYRRNVCRMFHTYELAKDMSLVREHIRQKLGANESCDYLLWKE
jgi:hypothetical protein